MSAILRNLLSFKGRQFIRYSCVNMYCRSKFSDSKLDLVSVSKENNLHLIGINRPEKRNCVNPATAQQLISAFKAFSDDPDARVAVLYGVGGTFCAGYDLKEVASGDANILPAEDGPMGPTCDLRVMEETAKVGVFCRRFGVPLIDGGTVRLPQLIGLSRALDLILTGRAVGGLEAYQMGLVAKLCKKGQALEVAVDLAKQLCAYPQTCMLADRESAYNAVYNSQSLNDALQFEFEKSMPSLVEAVSGAQEFVDGIGRHGAFAKDSDQIKSKL